MKFRPPFLLFLLALCLPAINAQEEKLDSLLEVILFEDEELVSLLTEKTNFQFLYARILFYRAGYRN